MSSASPRPPLIAVVGATGTGKSQLAVSLARRFNGEIINGDALQMYEGLPITTNKLPLEQRRGVPHHLLGCVTLGEEPWTVKKFVEQAAGTIGDITSRHRLPILVGGTHYYTQSLLFGDTLVEEMETDEVAPEKRAPTWHMLNANAEEMLEELRRVDPEMAKRWHPRDKRKIRRSLEIWLKTGKTASEVYDQQKMQSLDICSGVCDRDGIPSGSNASVQPRIRYNSLVFWLHTPSAVLNSKLEERVDNMIAHGLLEEVTSMRSCLQDWEQQGYNIDQSRGIWVAIGYKEFLPYIMDASRPEMLKRECIERTKIATRQYAKSQDRWIRLRLQRAVNAADLAHKMFLLDATDSSQWSDTVNAKAQDIMAAFVGGNALPEPRSLSHSAAELLVTPEKEAKIARHCEACDKTLMFQSEWIKHLKSKTHRASVRPNINKETSYPKNSGHR